MDLLLHDVYLPGLAHDGRIKGSAGQNENVGLASSLMRLLRDPYTVTKGNVKETVTDSTTALGGEWRKEVLRLKLQQAKCYTDWLAAASELDDVEQNDIWKYEEESDEYDVALVRARMQQLEETRMSCDAERLLFLVRTTLTRSLGGMGDLRLYKHSRVGTKALIERYIEAALDTLEALVDLSSPKRGSKLDTREVYDQLLRTRQAFGRSALLLSGGGTLGMNHIGVAKSLFEAQLLPRIISGASAGSIIAAVLCTRTDDEIPELLRDFCHGDLDVFEKEGEEDGVLKKAFRFLTKGALFDISNLIRVMRDFLGDMTFQEAYNRTRRILNICVSTASLYELPRLLNYVTAPNVMIWSAVATSCSVPFIFSPAQLLAKDPRTGKEVPWDHSPQRWIDGSVDNDLPMTRLAEMFNVNHFIVCQVNPHVVPFLERNEEIISTQANQPGSVSATGSTWFRTMAELAKGEALHRMHVLSELGVMPTIMSKVRSVLSQRYSGDITILPEVSYAEFPNVLKNPTPEFMLQSMLSGERATWPKLSQVRNHCAIELALDDAVQRVRTRLVFSPSQVDLRMSAFARSDGLNLSGRGKRRGKRRASHESSPPPNESFLLAVPQHFRPSSSSSYDRFGTKVAGSDIESTSSGLESGSSSILGDVEYSEDFLSSSSPDSPPSPRPQVALWPHSRHLSSSISQPSTPSIASKLFTHASSQPSLTMTPATAVREPSGAEKRYKQLFHNSSKNKVPVIQTEVIDTSSSAIAEDEDVSGTRGMVRRKRSLSTGLKGIWPPRRR